MYKIECKVFEVVSEHYRVWNKTKPTYISTQCERGTTNRRNLSQKKKTTNTSAGRQSLAMAKSSEKSVEMNIFFLNFSAVFGVYFISNKCFPVSRRRQAKVSTREHTSSSQSRKREKRNKTKPKKENKKFVSFIQQFIKRIIDPNGRRMANVRKYREEWEALLIIWCWLSCLPEHFHVASSVARCSCTCKSQNEITPRTHAREC